jgi:hypothetical protein
VRPLWLPAPKAVITSYAAVCRYVVDVGGTVMSKSGLLLRTMKLWFLSTAFVFAVGFQLAKCNLSLGDKSSVQNDSQQANQLILACTVHCVIWRLSCTLQFYILCVTQMSTALLPNISTVHHRSRLLWRHLFFFMNVQCTRFLLLKHTHTHTHTHTHIYIYIHIYI